MGKRENEYSMLKGLHDKTLSYTFDHPNGLLMSTQFSQPALALMEMAEFENLKARGVLQCNATFAGHSLGEYAALGACTSTLPLEDLLDLIFYRGVKMNSAVKRDEGGRTDYSMMAIDPSRVNEGKTPPYLESMPLRSGQY